MAHQLGTRGEQARHAAPVKHPATLAIASTESSPCIHQCQTQGLTRHKSIRVQLCGGHGCCAVATGTQPPHDPFVLPRALIRPPWRLRQMKTCPAYTMDSLRPLRGKIHLG